MNDPIPGLRPGRLGLLLRSPLENGARLALSCSLELSDLLVQLFVGRRQLRNLALATV